MKNHWSTNLTTSHKNFIQNDTKHNYLVAMGKLHTQWCTIYILIHNCFYKYLNVYLSAFTSNNSNFEPNLKNDTCNTIQIKNIGFIGFKL